MMICEFCKTIIAMMVSGMLHVFLLFPISQEKILFFPANGHYYCNLKYIDEKMREKKLPFKEIWVDKIQDDMSYSKKIKRCTRYSLAFLYHFFTAKVVLFNDGLPSWLFKRSGQVFINTWHGGGAYKKIDAVFKNMPNNWEKNRRKRIWDSIDYMVSSCQRFTEVFQSDTGIKAKFLPIGMPRNDLFFDPNKIFKVSSKIRKHYGLDKNVGIVLYAPTFRDNGIKLDLDVEELLHSLQIRFHKRFVLFVRSHPHIAKDIFDSLKRSEDAVDVSTYPDMQELLAATDVLITDYSSSMWDFSFTKKPCFIYANDLHAYRRERNFHTPIERWPFPLAENNRELQKNILSFDEMRGNTLSYLQKLLQHHKELGSFEQGNASYQICRLIEDICNSKEKLN